MRDNNIEPKKLKHQIAELVDNCGIPEYAVRGIHAIHTGLLKDVVTPDKQYVISKVSQLRMFKHLANSDEDNLCMFAGDRFPTFARYAAVIMAAQRLYNGHLSYKYFKWINVQYGTGQYELDEFSSYGMQMIVIDAVYKNSTSLTLEKIRELIQRYDSPTIIVIGAGGCPSLLAHNVLHIDPSRWLRFS